MNHHAKPNSISEQADHLEEEMMHELESARVTKSTLCYLAEGEVKYDTSPPVWAKNPKAIFNMGEDPRLPPMPEKPTLIDYFRYRFRLDHATCCKATHALKDGHSEKDRARLPAARHRRGELHPLRPRLLGRADDRAYASTRK